MAILVKKGVVKIYTPTVNTLVVNTKCGDDMAWQTDPSEKIWIPMGFESSVDVAAGSTLYFRTINESVELAEAPQAP